MNDWPTPLVCSGREVDDQLRPVGDPCGAKFKPRTEGGGYLLAVVVRVGDDGSFGPARRPTVAEQDEQARNAGWSVVVLPDGSRAVTCRKCRKPNPQVVADCKAIQQDLLTREPDRPATTTKE